MDVEKTIRFLADNAAAHSARLDRLERAVLGLTEHQNFLQSAVERTQQSLLDTQRLIRDLATQTGQRFAEVTHTIVELSRLRTSGSA